MIGSNNGSLSVASFTKEVNSILAKRPLVFNGRLANRGLTSLVKEATGQHQAIIWATAGILLIGPLRTKFNEISIAIHAFSFKKMHLKMSSANWRPLCLGPNVLNCD